MEACVAYATALGGTSANCFDTSVCSTVDEVCYSDINGNTCTDFCWAYTGGESGGVFYCNDCTNFAGTWG
jgi:hypothetical protein